MPYRFIKNHRVTLTGEKAWKCSGARRDEGNPVQKSYDDGVSEVFNRIIQARNHLIRKHLSDKYKHFVRLRFRQYS